MSQKKNNNVQFFFKDKFIFLNKLGFQKSKISKIVVIINNVFRNRFRSLDYKKIEIDFPIVKLLLQ